MSKVPIPLQPEDWFLKEFEFNLPLGAFLAVMERVRGTPARLEELIGGIPAALWPVKLGDDWSIQEQVGHLSDLDELHEGRLDDYRGGKDVLRAADLTNRKTYESHHNDAAISSILAAFREQRLQLVARLDSLAPEIFAQAAHHPRLNVPMRLVDMLFFQAEHDDFHLARISELRRLFGV